MMNRSSSTELEDAFVEVALFISRWNSDIAQHKVDGRSSHVVDLAELKRVVEACTRLLAADQNGARESDLLCQHADPCEDWMLQHLDMVTEFASLPALSAEAQIMKRLAQHWITIIGSRILREWKFLIDQEWLSGQCDDSCDRLLASSSPTASRHRWFAKTNSWSD